MPLLVFILSIPFPLSMICYSKSVLIRTFSSKMFLMSFLSTFLVNLVKNMNYMSKWHLFSTSFSVASFNSAHLSELCVTVC